MGSKGIIYRPVPEYNGPPTTFHLPMPLLTVPSYYLPTTQSTRQYTIHYTISYLIIIYHTKVLDTDSFRTELCCNCICDRICENVHCSYIYKYLEIPF